MNTEPIQPMRRAPRGIRVTDYLGEFTSALRGQLEMDYLRWGDTWLNRPRRGQEIRNARVYARYFYRYFVHGEPIPWLKIAGNAMIAYVREHHAELFADGGDE